MIENNRLLLPYAAPYFAYTAIASLPAGFVSIEVNYILRIAVTTALLVWGWKWYLPVIKTRRLPASFGWGALYGVMGCILWIAALTPLSTTNSAEPWSSTGFILRLFAAGLIVPIFEELMIRGFAFRLAYQWYQCRIQRLSSSLETTLHERSINDVSSSSWSWPAVLISVFIFMMGHTVPEWPAACLYGLLMTHLLIRQQGLLPCIIAHAITNITLAAYVFSTNSWYLW